MRDRFIKLIFENPVKANDYFIKCIKKNKKLSNKGLKIMKIFYPNGDYSDDLLLEVMDIIKK